MTVPVTWYVIGGLIALLGVQEFRVQTKKVDVLECKNEQSAAQIFSYQSVAQTEGRWRLGGEGVTAWEVNRAAALESDRIAADRTSSRLRDQLATLSLVAGQCATSASQLENERAAESARMLAVMSERIDQVAGVFARVADQRRDVGLSCEQRYEVITK